MTFQEQLRRRALSYGFSGNPHVAEYVGVSQHTFTQWCNGSRLRRPSLVVNGGALIYVVLLIRQAIEELRATLRRHECPT